MPVEVATSEAGHTAPARRRRIRDLDPDDPASAPARTNAALQPTDRAHLLPGPRSSARSLDAEAGDFRHLDPPCGSAVPTVNKKPMSVCLRGLSYRRLLSCADEPAAHLSPRDTSSAGDPPQLGVISYAGQTATGPVTPDKVTMVSIG